MVSFLLIECDISVPLSSLNRFSEMALILNTIEVGREHHDEHMLKLARERDYLLQTVSHACGCAQGQAGSAV